MIRIARAAFRALSVSGVVIASSACGVTDVVRPEPTATLTQQRLSGFVPSAASLSLGIPDGIYIFTIDPAQAQSLLLGAARLDIPGNAICSLAGSGYGAAYWNSDCAPETQFVTITVTARGANSDHPRVDFSPALRFSPRTSVTLYMYGKGLTKKKAESWLIYYCDERKNNACVNESLTDPSLVSYLDKKASVIFRRIKHFSGYLVAE